MSETNIEQNPQQPTPPQATIQLDTKIEFLNQKFYFHDILKASNTNRHYIAEDLEFDASQNSSGGFFYLKQSLYSHKGEYQYALKYYQKLFNYCKMPFAKTDIIRLHQIHNFDIEDANYFELVLIFDLGEPDRIDIDNIESQHITKFLKNVCLLLQDLKKFDQIYHGNIYIKNIVLVNTELKLSGFKPIYLENPDYQTWKVQLAKKYNHFRSDLYLIGLIWLRFLGANVEEATNINEDLETVIGNINAILQGLPAEKKMHIVLRLLDLEKNPDLTLDDVLLDFDEFYILENIRSFEQEKKRLAESGAIEDPDTQDHAFAFADNRTNSMDERFDFAGGPLKKSDSKETNPFMRPYKESERDLHAQRADEPGNNSYESKPQQELLKIEGDFTLQDDDSILPSRLSKDELIIIQDVKRDHAKSLFDPSPTNEAGKKYESNTINNKMSSEKRLGLEAFEEERNSMRKLKSSDGLLITDSKKEINENDRRISGKINHKDVIPEEHRQSVQTPTPKSEKRPSETASNKRSSVKSPERSSLKEPVKRPSVKSPERSSEKSPDPKLSVKSPDRSSVKEQGSKLSDNSPERASVKSPDRVSLKEPIPKQSVKSPDRASAKEPVPKLSANSPEVRPSAKSQDEKIVAKESGPGNKFTLKEPIPKFSFKTKNEKISVAEQNNNESVKTSENKVSSPSKRPQSKSKKEPNSPENPQNSPSKKISNFNKKVKKNKPAVYEIEEEKPSASQILRDKRAELQALKEEVELTPEQRIKIQKAVERELEKRTQLEIERLAKQKEDVERKAFEAKLQENNMRDKLDRITQERLQRKKEKIRNELKKKQEQIDNRDQEFYQKYLKDLEKKEQLERNRDKSPEQTKAYMHSAIGVNVSSNYKEGAHLQNSNETGNLPLKKTQRSLFDIINKRAAKDFQLSSLDQREILFSYNRDLENKQVPFKRVTQNPEKYQTDFKRPVSTLDNLFRTLDHVKQKELAQNKVEEPIKKKASSKGKIIKRKSTGESKKQNAEIGNKSPSFGVLNQKNEKQSNSDKPKVESKNLSKSKERKVSSNLNESADKRKATNKKNSKNPYSSNPKKSSPEKLPNAKPKQEEKNLFFESLFSRADFQNLDPITLENKIYIKTIEEAQNLSNANKTDEAIALLLSAKEKLTDNRKVEVMKMAGSLFQKIGQSGKTKEILLETLEYILPNNSIENKEDNFKSIIINLVLIAIEEKDYQEALNLLKNPVFKEKETMPNNYYGLMGDCLMKMGNHKEATIAFNEQLAIWLKGQITLEIISPLFILINKIILNYNSQNDQISIAKFFSKMVNFFLNVKKVNLSLQLNEDDFGNLIEQLSLNVLGFAAERQNYNLMNYVLNEIIGKNLLGHNENMNEEERVRLCDYIVHFCNYLKKLDNYGGFKANFIKYLDYAKEIIKNCDLNPKNLKINLLILFNRGIFYLQEQNYEKAEKLFDKCLEVYYAFFNEPDKDLYSILYNIGLSLYRKKKPSQSAYFFNKMLDPNCQDPFLKEKATKYLTKIYYRIGEFAKCREILELFVKQHFEGKSAINYYRYLSFYYLCLAKLKSENFNPFLENLQDEVIQNPNIETKNYLAVFQNMNNILINHHNYKDNEKFLGMLQDLASDKKLDKSAKSAKLVNLLSLLHQKFIVEKSEDRALANKTLVQNLRDKWLTISENAEMAKDFLMNFAMILINRIPIFNERMKSHQSRQNLFDEIRSSVDSQSINIYLGQLFQGVSASNSEQNNLEEIVQKLQPKAQKGPINVSETNLPEKEVKKVTSEQVLQQSAPERRDCLCGDEYRSNVELAELIEGFLKQVKNMLFLDVTENVEAYYLRFEAALKERGISSEKYSYIKKLIQYHLLRKKYQKLDRLKFTQLLDDLIEGNNLCVHDFKLIVVILESFKEMEYLHIFVIYLDTYHQNLATLIFQQVFLNIFNQKYQKIVAALYKKIYAFRFYQLENFPLMHYLESQNFINIEKELHFKIFTRLRYDIMAEDRMNKIFSKYIEINELHMFYVKYNTYVSIVSAIKRENVSSLNILSTFYTNLSSAVINYQIEEIHARHYVYDFLILLNVLKFKEDEDLSEIVFEILSFIEERLPQSLYYHFSAICSAIGNIFFKYHFSHASLKAKLKAFEMVNRATDVDTEAPKYIIQEDPETHLMQILSFLVVSQIELKNLSEAKVFLEKVEQINNEFALNELLKQLLKALFFYHAELPKQSREVMNRAEALFSKMTLKDILFDIFRASMDKIKLLIAIKLDSPEEIKNRARTSEGSIKQLYRPVT